MFAFSQNIRISHDSATNKNFVYNFASNKMAFNLIKDLYPEYINSSQYPRKKHLIFQNAKCNVVACILS